MVESGSVMTTGGTEEERWSPMIIIADQFILA
jgi:hypothetical protein